MKTMIRSFLIHILILFTIFYQVSANNQLVLAQKINTEAPVKIRTTSHQTVLEFTLADFHAKKNWETTISPSSPSEVNLAHELTILDYQVPGLAQTNEVKSPNIPFYSLILAGEIHENDIDVIQSSLEKNIFYADSLPSAGIQKPCRCEKESQLIDKDSQTIKFLELKAYDLWQKNKNQDPSPFFKIEALGKFRGVQLSRLLIYPLQVDLKTRSTKLYPELKIQIHHEHATIIHSPKDLWSLIRHNNKMLILSTKNYEWELSDYMTWKKSLGFDVTYVVDESLNDSFKVKNFLHQKYQELEMSYTILIGNLNEMPTEFVATSMSVQTPSDLNYFTMDGENDFLPEVFYARFVIDQAHDLLIQTKKIIEYEQLDPSISHHLIGIASDEGFAPSDEEYLAQAQKPLLQNFSITTNNFLQKNPNANVLEINRALSQGAIWMNYIGHGSGLSWPSLYEYEEYHGDDIQDYQPSKIKPIIIDVACQNGRFDGQESLGKMFINAEVNGVPSGAVAFYGGSVNISWDPPAIMAAQMTDQMVKNQVTRLGDALWMGQLELLRLHHHRPDVIDNFRWYHLFGDPTTRLPLP